MQLSFSHAELTDDHEGLEPHVIAGQRLHGGFASGEYVPPRSRTRVVALDAWTQALRQRGGDLFAADSSLLSGPQMPNARQHALLIERGVTQTFWDSLTTTGKLEARGRVLAEAEFPDLAELVVEDISEMAIGHLAGGLLWAHGIDEGGQPEQGIGGHDVMWFAARDLVFDPGAHADVEPPENIARPEADKRWLPELPARFEGMLSLLMNLLIIEFRAEIFFANAQATLLNPALFRDRRDAAEQAAEIIERIRIDEKIHVDSLRLYLGELCEVTLRTEAGGTIAGRELVMRFWDGLVAWAVHEQPRLAARERFKAIQQVINASGDAALLDDFLAIADDF